MSSGWNGLAQTLLGGLTGYGEAGLEEVQREKKLAREEGLARLKATLNRENMEYQADRADERDKLNRENALEAEKIAAGRTSADVQKLEWLKKEGLLDAYLDKGGKTSGVTEGDISKSYAKYLSGWDPINGEPMSRAQYKQTVFGQGGSAQPAPSLAPETIDHLAGMLNANAKQNPSGVKKYLTELGDKWGVGTAQAVTSRAVQMQDGESLRSAVEHNTYKPMEADKPILSSDFSAFIGRLMNGGSGVSTTDFGKTKPTAQDEQKSFLKARPY